jgi:hypothetical protein
MARSSTGWKRVRPAALSVLLCGAVTSHAQTLEREQTIPPFERGAGDPVEPGAKQDAAGEASLDLPMSTLPADFEVPRATQLAEGTYLPRVLGRAIAMRRGGVVFMPDVQQPASAGGPSRLPTPLPAMVLLPTTRRDQLAKSLVPDEEAAPTKARAKTTDEETQDATDAVPQRPSGRFAVGGQVYVYRGRTYLLLGSFASMVEEAEPAAAAPVAPPTTPEDAARDAVGVGGEDVDRLISELERAGAGVRTLQAAPADGPKNDASVVAALTEGSVLTNRRGRLVRQSAEGGRFAFVIDNDPNSPGLPPLLLLPCQMLEQVEGVVSARGEELVVRMSGRVLTTDNKPALLPVFFQVERASEIVPGQ